MINQYGSKLDSLINHKMAPCWTQKIWIQPAIHLELQVHGQLACCSWLSAWATSTTSSPSRTPVQRVWVWDCVMPRGLLVNVVSVELDHDCCHCFFPDPLTVSSFVGRISKTMASRRKPEDVALALFERGAPKARCFRPRCFLTVWMSQVWHH